MGELWCMGLQSGCCLLACAEFYSWCALQHQARRPSERDFHRARLEAFRTNYEALLAELGGTHTRHEPSDTHKRRR